MPNRHEIDKDGDLILQLSRVGLYDAEDEVAEDEASSEDADEKLANYEQVANDELRSSKRCWGKIQRRHRARREHGVPEPYSIDFPDDDVEAMTILCQILHNVYVSERPKPIGLSRLASIGDKYECINALKYCGMVWIRDWLQDFEENEPAMVDFCHLLVFSYVIDLPSEFSEISWRMFLYHEGPFSSTSDQIKVLVDHPLLRHDIIRKYT
ncbi:hypothetical protein ColKHC_03527 [Colletotrichum higginsianum]|nr:hypothetical protein ColKHC_03527 [Colletotrichum higginsianum]